MLKGYAAGRVVKDAEVLPYSNGQGSLVKFTLACDRGFGENKSTSFLNCVIFGRDENTAQYILQGNQMICHGDIVIPPYEGGNNYNNTQMIVTDFDFGAKKK